MHRLRFILIVFLTFLFFSSAIPNFIFADTIYLKNGWNLKGVINKETDEFVELEVCQGRVRFERSEIESIKRLSSEESHRMLSLECERQRALSKELMPDVPKKESKPNVEDVQFAHTEKGIEVDVVLNGRTEAKMILDTGASLVLLTKDLAKRLGVDVDKIKQEANAILADGKETKVRYFLLDTVTMQGLEAKKVEAAILLEDVDKNKFADGLLGMSFLKRFNFKVDQKNKKVMLEAF